MSRPPRPQRQQPAEPEVGTFTVRPQSRALVRELPGRIAPTRVSDVRARVSGIVVERLFQQGTEVKAGDPLYRIDPQAVRGGTAGERSRAGQGDGRARSGRAACAAHRDADQPARGARGRERKGHRRPAPGRGRGRRPQGRRRARQAQSRLRDDPRADQRRRRRGAGQRRRAGGAERDHQPRHDPAARSDLCRLHPIGHRRCNKLRRAFDSGDLDRIAPDAAKVRLVLDDGTVYPIAGQAAVLRSQGRCLYRAGDAARRVSQSEARIAAGHVCPRPDRAGHRFRRHRGAAAGDPAQWRRRQRSVRGQGRRPRRDRSRCAPARCRTACGWSARA